LAHTGRPDPQAVGAEAPSQPPARRNFTCIATGFENPGLLRSQGPGRAYTSEPSLQGNSIAILQPNYSQLPRFVLP